MTYVLAPLGAIFRHVHGPSPDAEEILLVSFNHDLAFFEKVALGPAQLTGARITIVADASMAHHDVYAVRRAGTAYLPGLARCSRSFHPKLMVIASTERATVGIGSGNMSMAGWQGNDELWSWHNATTSEGSSIVPSAGRWLHDLAAAVTVAGPVEAALRRVGTLLQTFPATDDSCRLAESVTGRIIDQLPTGPVDELNVYAPFFDPNADALRELIHRLQPAQLVVGYQPSMTKINGAAVAALAAPNTELRELTQERYRHGKLIEWATGDQRFALTGSANLSAAAMLSTVANGGNVELGVIAPTSATLMPDGAPATASHLATIEYRGVPPAAGPATVILFAVRTVNGVDVDFLRPLKFAGRIEASQIDWPPDHWEPVAEVLEGQSKALLPDLPGGSRLRVRDVDGVYSATAWVTDLDRVHRTRAAVRSGPKPPEIGEVFSDVSAAEKFFNLHLERQKATPLPATTGTPTGTSGSTPADIESWEEYLDRCASRVGAYTFAFSFGLPLPTSQPDQSAQIRITDWDDDTLDDSAEVLEGDDADTAEVEDDRRLVLPQLAKAQDAVRARFRTVARRMIRDWVAPEPQERLLALRSALLLVASGAWEHTEEDWQPLVLEGVDNLRIQDPSEDYAKAAGSLALLALSVVRSTLSMHERGLLENQYDRVLERAASLVIEGDPTRLDEYADGLTARFPASATSVVAMGIVERLTVGDELDNALDDLAEQGIVAELIGRVIDLTKRVPDPYLSAVWAMAIAAKATPIAVRSASNDDRFVNVLWRPPDVVVIDSPKPGAVWARHYHYPPGRSPAADVRLNTRLDADRCIASTSIKQPLPDIATELLAVFGMSKPAPPGS